MYPLLEFLSTLPQFHADRARSEVVHIGTGCILSSRDSYGPDVDPVLLARWPGQPLGDARTIDGLDAVNFYMRQARSMGAEVGLLNRAIGVLDRSMGGETLFSKSIYVSPARATDDGS
ncbi:MULTISPECIES: hypothetical protein [unclassified Caballeronia]|uniref:hypothetical protein n=1 Tax=unclassified Caballeronia TaxID=2646786 RepID=UPI00285BE0CB|nr:MULTISPECIES: hypothetical protein [unclassified Caballeronia]MDR5815199.1 hypothetical protein [Caballeronia sp. LZ033]MDR5822659.1 hypothetical protein [Caballeronia sp. LZ043]MDR5879936.1 hypothetical protein [Caballeronia sp. LZ032]